MSNNLNLSVVLPTINRPDDLVRAVTSILRQNELPYELIIVDQSVDSKSHNNIKDLFSKLKPNTKLVYIHDSSIKGLVSAKNHGVKKSNGEIISFLEDDEFLDKNYLKNTINLFDKNEHILGCCGIVSNIRRSFFYEIMFKLFHQGLFFDKRVDAVKYKDSDGKGILISSTHLSGGISSYRREVFESIEYDLRTNFFYCEDIDFSIRASDFFGRNRFVIATNIFLAHYMSNINRDVLQPRWMRKTNEFILLYKKNKHKKYSYLSVIWLMVGLFFEAIYSSIITFSIGPVVGFFIGLYSGINYKIIDTYSVRKTSKEDFANEMVYSNKSSNNKKTRNIIFLTKYGNLAASSRLRAYQYKDKINSPKWNIEVQSLLSNKYLENRFKNNSFNVFVLFHVVYLFLVRLFFC
ncbi:glycosyltransferase family 2 protein [Candidatus Pseudothioglobus sp. Uisw_016]|uniref:glycosyltransferase family 2 protein n=1 Tax=Candidatus Pseudothioglobus sp. Uisw_016 TaxID=3230995 RepID=UPI003A8AB582